MLKKVGEKIHPFRTPTVVLNHSESCSCVIIHLTCSYKLVVQELNGANKIYIDIVLPHGGPMTACHTLSNAFLKSMKTC